MKITVIGPVYPYRGGIAHYTTLLARALSKRHQVRVISFLRQYPRWLYPGKTDKDPSRQPLRVEAEYLLDTLYPWTWWQTANQIFLFQPEVVIFPWWTTFWAPAFAVLTCLLRQKNLKTLFLIHNVLPHEARFWDAWLARLALRQGQAFVVQTAREKNRLLTFVPEAVVEICPHPVYEMFKEQYLPHREARQKLGLPLEWPVALFFGIVRPYKGLKYLIEAIARLGEGGEKVYLVVAGEFWEDKRFYQRQVENLGLTRQVRLEDRYIPNEEVGLFFSAADVFVAPYVGGTQSGALKMAIGFGVPVITTQIEALPEGVLTHQVGWCVPPEDDWALAGAISTCLRAVGSAAWSNPPVAVPDYPGWDCLVTVIERLAGRREVRQG